MNDNNISLRRNTDLAARSDSLIQRGIDFISNPQVKEVTLESKEIQAFIDKYTSVREKIGGIPQKFIDGKTTNPHDVESFDLNLILEAFDRVTMRKGHKLDYVYAYDGHGGEPLVYARAIDEPPVSTPDEYYERFNLEQPEMLLGQEPTSKDSLPYLAFLTYEHSAIGCFQFALFCMTIRRFYLYWHSNYNERHYILTERDRDFYMQEEVGDITPHDVDAIKSLKLGPTVLLKEGSAEVIILNFEENIGYSNLHVYLSRPNSLDRIEDRVVIPPKYELLY
jgi:hypothetical protein